VPITLPVRVRLDGSTAPSPSSLAIPKSSKVARAPAVTSSSGTNTTLSGLRSRWTMPRS